MASVHQVEKARGEGTLLGIPMGDLGWFQSILIGLATGFAAFFLATFLAIIAFGIYAAASHKAIDFAYTYKRIGMPVGIGVGTAALAFLAVQWLRRLARKGSRGE